MEKKVKQKMSNKKFMAIWIPVLAVVLVLTVMINVLMNIFSGYVDLYLGRGDIIITQTENSESWDSDYYPLDYDSKAAVQVAANEMVEKIESEGIVLLKNSGALPLAAQSRITLFGRAAADPVYGGSGSGSVKLDSVVDLKAGLENANYNINETVYSILNEFAAYTEETGVLGATRVYTNPRGYIAMDNPSESSYYIGEMPVQNYNTDAIASFASYGDAAIVVFGRPGGEGGDLTQDMKGWDENYAPGQHQLELNRDEKEALALAKQHFDTVIVIINSNNVMELGELESDTGVDAILWIGSPGQTGFNAVGKVLNGAVTPSGRTADIYPADFTQDPSFVNFGNYQYSNISKSNATGDAFFVQYEEGIYIGYRYYETAAVEGFINYDDAVVYPFGHGLSYTTFDWRVVNKNLGEVKEDITIEVEVTNTGSADGKEVVQLYYSAPYTKGGIEKSHVVLGDFAKTKLLTPGESQVVTLSLKVEDMSSYDYNNDQAYILEAGDYQFLLQTDSHNTKEGCDPIVYNVSRTMVYDENNHRASDLVEVSNEFDDVSAMFTDVSTEGYATNLSRADFASTFPTSPSTADMVARDSIIEGYQAYVAKDLVDPDVKMPTTSAKNGLNLIDLRGLSYDDPSWELLLDQLTPDTIKKLVLNGAYNSAAIASIGKPAAVDFDGPAGISSYMTSLSCTSYPSEVVIASTFNVELVYEMGKMVGNEGLANKVNGWYAPAMNIHRSQFAGRNFEYYSEDPLLSGKIGAACVSGTAEKGMYAFIKHYALNDQETNRINNGVSTWANEQTIREIYLKPFEYVVKNATQQIKYISDEDGTVSEVELKGCTAVMSSFNRVGAVWAGGSVPLMQNILRDEWGFEGMVITDFNLYPYMYPDQGIMAGSDLMLSYDSMKSLEDISSATAVINLRKSAHNILYTVANSNVMNGVKPGSIITYTKAPWVTWLIAADVLISILLCVGVAWVLIRTRRHKREKNIECAMDSGESI